MTEIINCQVVRNDTTKNAMGGTELIAEAMVKYLDHSLLDKFQIIHSRVREIVPGKKLIYVAHDLPNDPEAQHLGNPAMRNRFSGIVFPSNWSMNAYNTILGVPYSEATVLKNAIVPIGAHTKPASKPIRLIYHTTPHRGLEILVPVFYELAKHHDIELDIYSSFNIYGWGERDKDYENVFEQAKAHPKIRYHGSVSNDEIREALKQAHIFPYPSIWPETSCIAAIEAMSAGCLVVCPNLAALSETCNHFGLIYQWTEDKQKHALRFLALMHNVLSHIESFYIDPSIIDIEHSWSIRADEWNDYMRAILENKS